MFSFLSSINLSICSCLYGNECWCKQGDHGIRRNNNLLVSTKGFQIQHFLFKFRSSSLKITIRRSFISSFWRRWSVNNEHLLSIDSRHPAKDGQQRKCPCIENKAEYQKPYFVLVKWQENDQNVTKKRQAL